ncbi:MAG TPA: SDR family NAD(P)-dependent oxidoreductase [Actinomycetota bacterium]
MRIDGAVVLLTGASSGIGAATAPLLAERGARLLLAGRDRDALAAAAERCGGQVLAADLADPGATERLAAEALACHGRVDLLINNAGAGWAGPLAEMALDRAARLVALNLLAPMALARLLLPGMLERRHGHLVFVTSIAGVTGVGGEAVYAAAKGGLATFAASLREELSGRGVGISLVVPGVVATPFFDRRGTPYARTWPRPIAPERVAAALLRAVESDRAEVFAPAWMRFPARLAGSAPALYRTLAIRFGATRPS